MYWKSEGIEPSGRKENLGTAVLVSSIKFNDAQNCPERIFVNFFQFEETLKKIIIISNNCYLNQKNYSYIAKISKEFNDTYQPKA